MTSQHCSEHQKQYVQNLSALLAHNEHATQYYYYYDSMMRDKKPITKCIERQLKPRRK